MILVFKVDNFVFYGVRRILDFVLFFFEREDLGDYIFVMIFFVQILGLFFQYQRFGFFIRFFIYGCLRDFVYCVEEIDKSYNE